MVSRLIDRWGDAAIAIDGDVAERFRVRLPVTHSTVSPTRPPRRSTALRPLLTRASFPVSWMNRLAANWAAISTGWLSRWACTSSSSGSMGPGNSTPVVRSTFMM